MMAQIDPSVMKGNDGEWSLVGVLLFGFAGALSALIFIYRQMDAARVQEIADLKRKLEQLEQRNEACYEDRLKIHAELLALKREVELLKAAK
jgi:hypothetical protein